MQALHGERAAGAGYSTARAIIMARHCHERKSEMTMSRAVRLREFGPPEVMRIEQVDLPDPGAGEARVRQTAIGFNFIDVYQRSGVYPLPLPTGLGHEAAGVVEALGSGVTDLVPGDHVVLVFVPSCGHCVPCSEGRPALCEPGAQANGAGTLLAGGRRLARGSKPVHHHLGVSGLQGRLMEEPVHHPAPADAALERPLLRLALVVRPSAQDVFFMDIRPDCDYILHRQSS